MKRHSLALLAVAAALPSAAQDLTIVSKVTSDGRSSTATSYLASDRIRMAQAEGQEFLIDLKAARMTVLSGKTKTYYVMTRQDLEQLRARMEQVMNSPEMKQAQERMKELPPEQREKMEGLMGGSFEVKRTGTSRRIAGYPCQNWTITFGALSRAEECLTTELHYPIQAWDMYRDFAESLRSMMAALGPMAKGFQEMQEKFQEMKGFPLATTTTVTVMGQTTTSTSEVTEIKRGPIPPSAWEIPAGYRQVENPTLKALQSPR